VSTARVEVAAAEETTSVAVLPSPVSVLRETPPDDEVLTGAVEVTLGSDVEEDEAAAVVVEISVVVTVTVTISVVVVGRGGHSSTLRETVTIDCLGKMLAVCVVPSLNPTL